MNPIQLTHTLEDTLISYLMTIFDVNRDGNEPELAEAIRKSISADGALFNGPYLEITPPYKRGASISALCDQDILSLAFENLENPPIPIEAGLYTHQVQAIRKITSEKHSIVVSSGTGSGKTESFLIPILNDLLMDPSDGVRAVLIYPLNALVNDQMDRLRKLLKGTDITFGRYTSELAETTKDALDSPEHDMFLLPNEVISRDEIRLGEKLPQILITNYAMLEYLLFRPEDSMLFQRGAWRFLVLDEAHSYVGAQAIEIAMLIRRLKHRLNKQMGQMCCIATSATLTDYDAGKAAEFASKLFGEDIQTEDVIFGEVDEGFSFTPSHTYAVEAENYLCDGWAGFLENVRQQAIPDAETVALQMHHLGIFPDYELNLATDHPREFLYYALQGNQDLIRLREWMMGRRDDPAVVQEAANEIFGGHGLDSEQQRQALYHLIELGALARPDDEKPPLLPTRYHLFARPPQGIWLCLNPNCEGRTTSSDAQWSRMLTTASETCDACGCRVYPAVVCRECGQVYISMMNQNGDYIQTPENRYENDPVLYFTWKKIKSNSALGTEESSGDTVAISSPSAFAQKEFVLCLRCGHKAGMCQCKRHNQLPAHIKLQVVQQPLSKKDPHLVEVGFMNQCPRCNSKSQLHTEIVTPISVGGVTPLSQLTYTLFRNLPPSAKKELADKPGNGRKLLTFYDNRQGAARFAAILQDAVNTQNYRHIIKTAIQASEQEKGYAPGFKTASEYTRDLALNYQIFHNDPESDLWRMGNIRLTREQREEIDTKVLTRLIAEFTANRDERQSLERLGVIGVTYFEEDAPLLLNELSDKMRLPVEALRTLIAFLLDGLRESRVMTLPKNIAHNDPLFGGRDYPEQFISRDGAGQNEIAWIGKTQAQRRRRWLKAALEQYGLPYHDQAVIQVLGHLWEWLIRDDVNLLESAGNGAYQLNYHRVFFSAETQWYRCGKCYQLYAHGDGLRCPKPSCQGELERYDVQERQEQNYFFGTYVREVIPMRVEEHTAQLDSSKGRDYQNWFRDGRINALSCSTTFEMGIDLGDLQAVVMNNVPPTVANYRQRAGRAGRRASGTAFILTWASERPHDQAYFRNPPEIIRGHVRVPYLNLDNLLIRQRHMNALLLARFLKYRFDAGHRDLGKIGPFFDPENSSDEPHYAVLTKWLTLRRSELETDLSTFAHKLNLTADLEVWLREFSAMLAEANTEYQLVIGHYKKQYDDAHKLSSTPASGGTSKAAREDMDYYEKLIARQRQEFLINYLSEHGVLPSYSFPLHAVELFLPSNYDRDNLRLQRDLKQAIREYAPGNEVVADKRIWRSGGLRFHRETVRTRGYRICPRCRNLQISRSDDGRLLDPSTNCKICGESLKSINQFIVPDGFWADPKKSGSTARQYVQTVPSSVAVSLIPSQEFLSWQQMGTLIQCAYDRTGELLHVNEGDKGEGFYICLKCGRGASKADSAKPCAAKRSGGSCGGEIRKVSLGFTLETDTLHLRFQSSAHAALPDASLTSFWLSLMTALLHGASRALQIERRDIGGVLFPRQAATGIWEQTIVLYDNVPGGAGHVREIEREFPRVLREAFGVVSCTDCQPETSCYHCLRDYNNQAYHSQLKRKGVDRFLELLLDDLAPSPTSDVQGVGRVIAANRPFWLMRQVAEAKANVTLAADQLTLDAPPASSAHWLDTLYDLAQRNVQVELILRAIPRTSPEELSIRRYIQTLIDRGVHVYQTTEKPTWYALIDDNLEDSARAVRPVNSDVEFVLGGDTGKSGLLTTIHPNGISAVREQMSRLSCKQIVVDDLNPPPNTRVINQPAQAYRKAHEADFFADVFALPVVSLYINDAYLVDEERILNRLGAYIELAALGGALEKVTVITKKAGQNRTSGSAEEQDRAIEKLKRRFSAHIDVIHRQPDHDRYVVITRANRQKARIIIGQGLDFIQPDGRTKATFIVIEDPIT